MMSRQTDKQLGVYKELSILMHTHAINILSNLNDGLAAKLKIDSKNLLSNLLEIENTKLSNYLFAAVLYSPSAEKIPEWLHLQGDKFERHSLPEVLKRGQEQAVEERQLLQYLLHEADSLFEEILNKWSKKEHGAKTPDFKSIYNTTFAPKKQSVASALENLWYVKRKKKYRNYASLLDNWERFLKNYIFQKTNWSYEKKEYFFTAWKRRLFDDPSPPQFPLKGRWKEGLAIDEVTASKIILYFMDKFCAKPHRFAYGEISCLLLLAIHLSFDDRIKLNLKKILSLESSQFKVEASTIIFDKHEIIIPKVLSKSISLLKKCNGKLVFPNLSIEIVPRMLKEASEFLCLTPQILSEAFLSPPHVFYGLRILPWLSQGMMNRELLHLQPTHQIGGILKPYNTICEK